MKQTTNVDIGSVAFTIDEDAYLLLHRWLEDVQSRLDAADVDTIGDIENRVADLFNDRITSSMQVVNIDMVRMVIATIGRPEAFGPRKREPGYGYEYWQDGIRNRKLYRSTSSKLLAGVCGGIGEFFGLDPSLIRLATILMLFFGGMSFFMYILLWIVIPQSPDYAK